MSSNFKRRLRRVLNKKHLRYLVEDRSLLAASLRHQYLNGFGPETETLLDREFVHVAAFGSGNAGDTLLPTVLRDLLQQRIGGISWKAAHVHDEVGVEEERRLNDARAVVVGGGGLFIRDTNKNSVSGWQWPISFKVLKNLQPKLAIFAVGYNRFRGQEEFDGFFKENLIALVEKASFFGLRNHGSIRSVNEYLPEHLRQKVVFQPCMTTLISRIYPEHFQTTVPAEEGPIALNCAFDRSSLRFGDQQGDVLRQIAKAMKELSGVRRIAYYSHVHTDEEMLPYLKEQNVEFELVKLYDRPSRYVMERYKEAGLAIGMRGHAQMIPFGCERPILSLITHDKVKWFLDDIGAPEWGVEISRQGTTDRIVSRALEILANAPQCAVRIKKAQEILWNQTVDNCSSIFNEVLAR